MVGPTGANVKPLRRSGDVAVGRNVDFLPPEPLASRGVEAGQKHPGLGKHPGGRIDHAVFDNQPGPHGPARDHPPAAGQALIFVADAMFPDQPAIGRGKTVNEPVVAGDEDSLSDDHRRNPHGAFGGESPQRLAGRGADAINGVGRRGAVKQSLADNRRMKGVVGVVDLVQVIILVKEILLRRRRPGRRWRVGGRASPRQLKRQGELLGGDASAPGVVPKRRPVVGQEGADQNDRRGDETDGS